MTEEQLAEIEARCQAATGNYAELGYYRERESYHYGRCVINTYTEPKGTAGYEELGFLPVPDAELYKHARTDLPACVAYIRKLESDYNQEVDEFNAGHDAFAAGLTLYDEPSDTKYDAWVQGWKCAAYDAFEGESDG